MTRMLTLAGALSLAVVTATGVVRAAPVYNQNAPSSGLAEQEKYGQTVPWHYVWQYHYGQHGEWVPGYVAVLDSAH
jgi:hypothetical protein